MTNQAIIAIIAAALDIFASSFYIIDTIKGKTKPNRVTYLLWGVPIIAALATNSTGFTWSSLYVFAAGLMPLTIFFVSFTNKNSYWRLKKFDYICGAFAILALIIWLTTKNSTVAIIFSLIADFLAGLPTLIKIYNHPETETIKSYVICLFGQVLNLFAIKTWHFTEYAFPIYLVIFTSILVLASRIKRSKSK